MTQEIAPPTTAVPRRTALTPRQVAVASMCGTAIEYYDFLLYSFLSAVVFAPLFFPSGNPWLGTLAAISAQAVAFVARPVGGIVFGKIGDRYGRRPAVVWSLGLMGACSVAVGLLPTYRTIGVAAPVLLVLLRFAQGLAMGGEYAGAVLVSVEQSAGRRRTANGSFPATGIMIGIFLASGVMVLVSTVIGVAAFRDWGWRVAFLLSVVLAAIGIWLRRRLAETADYVEDVQGTVRAAEAGGIRVLLRDARLGLLAGTLAYLGGITFVYAFLTGIFAYTSNYVRGLSPISVYLAVCSASVVLIGGTLLAGHFGDRVGRERAIVLSGAWVAIWAVPSYLLIGSASAVLTVVAVCVGALAYALFSGVSPSLMADLFPTHVRYLGLAACNALASVFGGGVLPIAALALVGRSGGSSVPLMVMMTFAGLATVVGGVLAFRVLRVER